MRQRRSLLDQEARRRSDRVVDRLGAGGKVGLASVVLGRSPAEPGEPFLDLLPQVLVENGPDPAGFGRGLAGRIIDGRTEAAGGDDDGRPPECFPDRLGDAQRVVPDGRRAIEVDAGGAQAAGDRPGIRVEDVAEQQLGADRDDLGCHER